MDADPVLDAALAAFLDFGIRRTSMGEIARRAGISQPYVYALFPNQHELFLAANAEVKERIRGAFAEAARGIDTAEERLEAMGSAYVELLGNREEIMFQHQANAAAGDPALREPVRREFIRLFDDVVRLSGAPEEEVWRFIAHGMFLNVIAALDLPDRFYPSG